MISNLRSNFCPSNFDLVRRCVAWGIVCACGRAFMLQPTLCARVLHTDSLACLIQTRCQLPALHLCHSKSAWVTAEVLSDLVQAQNACENGRARLSNGRTGMVYVGSANTAAISAQLPDHPHILLLLQGALGSYLAGPNATLPSLVTDFPRTVYNKVHHV